MATHRVATETIQPYIDSILEHLPEVTKGGVTIDAMFAFGKKDGPPPVKLNGYPCAAVISANNVKARLRGLADVTITFDAAHWGTLDEIEKTALVHHECQHIKLKLDKDGQIKEDDAGRPVVGMALHDWQLGGFRSIAVRYKDKAPEVQAARSFKNKHGQYLFAWGDDNAPGDDMPDMAGVFAGHGEDDQDDD